jgi:threonine/homoserine/homoserine lactone efflux protein
MSLAHWLAFFVASNILLAVPGPTALVIVSYALGHGRRPAAAVVTGVALGDFTAMTCSMLGLGAILAASSLVFTGLRWIGGLYLIYLGIKLWRAPVMAPDAQAAPMLSLKRIFAHAYAVTALNPKSIVFFIAFVPQFIDMGRPFAPQVVILEATFVTLSALNAALYGWLAAKAREKLKSARVQKTVNRTGAAALMGAGMLALGWRNS